MTALTGTIVYSATIANGASLSDAVGMENIILTGVIMPASWTAANITFQASVDGVTFNNVYDSLGNELTVTAAASRYIAIDPSVYAGMKYLKVRSGTSSAAVNQGGARVIGLAGRDLIKGR